MPNAPCPFSSSAPDRIRRVGEVLATNTRTGKTSPETVSAVSVRHDTDLYDLKVKSGGRVAVIHTTSNHPFWDPQSRKWVQAGKLRVGEPLRTADGSTATADGGFAPATHDGLMWDLTVPGNNDHDFYVVPATSGKTESYNVGAAPILVHNASCPVPISKGRWDHIWDRHVNRSQWVNKSKFFTTNKAKVLKMINRALGGNADDGVYIYRFPSAIGEDAAGNLQYAIRVVVRNGKLITAFPSD